METLNYVNWLNNIKKYMDGLSLTDEEKTTLFFKIQSLISSVVLDCENASRSSTQQLFNNIPDIVRKVEHGKN
jgi:hypothetical protein